MLPGPTIVRECSTCGQQIQQPTLGSGNTFRATYWTDGKCFAPMLPDFPWLVKCPRCGTALWIDELRKIGELDCWGEALASTGSLPYVKPSVDDYYAVIGRNSLGREKEFYLRTRAWWTANDARREMPPEWDRDKAEAAAFGLELLGSEDADPCSAPGAIVAKERRGFDMTPMTKAEETNLLELAGLMDEEDLNELLMKAEIMRELGLFDQARSLLDKCGAVEPAAKVVHLMRALAERGDRSVRRIPFD